MLVWLVRNTVRRKMGLPLTKYENTVPEKTQYSETVKKLILEEMKKENDQVKDFDIKG